MVVFGVGGSFKKSMTVNGSKRQAVKGWVLESMMERVSFFIHHGCRFNVEHRADIEYKVSSLETYNLGDSDCLISNFMLTFRY